MVAIKWRKKSVFRLIVVLIVLGCLFTWTILLHRVNRSEQKTAVIGQNSQATPSSVISTGNPLWSANAPRRKSRRSQSIVENQRHNGATVLDSFLEEKPKTLRESLRGYSQRNGQRTSLLGGKAPKSRSGRDRRGKESVVSGALTNMDREDPAIDKKSNRVFDRFNRFHSTESSHSGKSVLDEGGEDQPREHVKNLVGTGGDNESIRGGESVAKLDSRLITAAVTVQRNLVRDPVIKAHLEKGKTSSYITSLTRRAHERNKTGNVHKDYTISARPSYTNVSVGRRGEGKENRPRTVVPEKLERVYTRVNILTTTLLGNSAKTSRRSVIIAAPTRSGSSFLGDAFNQHPGVFYLFEPLHGVNPSSHSNDIKAMEFLDGILKCKFTSARYVQQIDRFRRFSSNALSSPPLCANKTYLWTPKKKCQILKPANMEAVCKHNYSVTVMKVLTSRIPEYRIDSLFSICNSSNCSVLYLVRDPRALLYSHMKAGMINWEKLAKGSSYKAQKLPRPLIRLYSTHICQRMEQNIKVFQNLPREIATRYYMLRFEDLAKNPVEALRIVYKMAGLEMTNTTRRWITSHTEDTKISAADENNQFSTKRNSKAVLDNWRLEMDPCFADIVEESCHPVMKSLGYKLISRSSKVQYDLSVPLYTGH